MFDIANEEVYAYPQSPTLAMTGLASWNDAAQPRPLRFFCAYRIAFHNDGLSGALARVAGSISGTPTSFSPSPNDWRLWRRVYNLLRDAIMNTLQNQSVQNLPLIVWQNQPVITNELLASVYETDVNNIQTNFKRNTERFTEGQHFFKLTGQDLKDFKNQLTNCQLVTIAKNASRLILWTERGTVRHAKMLGTDKAWEVQENLEQFYFSQKAAASNPVEKQEALPTPPPTIPLNGTMVMEFQNGEAISCKPITKDTWIFDAGNEPGVKKLVYTYIPAPQLGALLTACMERMQAIAMGKQTT